MITESSNHDGVSLTRWVGQRRDWSSTPSGVLQKSTCSGPSRQPPGTSVAWRLEVSNTNW